MPRHHSLRTVLFALCLVLSALDGRGTAGDWKFHSVGRFVFDDDSVRELSGISWVSTDASGIKYFCVSDDAAVLIPLTLVVDLDSGEVTSASVGKPIPLNDGAHDLEGICFVPHSRSVLISNESEPGIRGHDVMSGHLLRKVDTTSHPQLNVFQNTIQNKAWESLTMSPDGNSIWTANEDTLSNDVGGTIRLQRFDADLNPTGQWAYDLSEPPETWIAKFALGVPDVLALPDGELVVMERGFGRKRGGLEARIQLFRVDTSAATGLDAGTIDGAARVSKSLLWEESFGGLISNFEGITLGPTLSNGDRSVLLVADNGGTTTKHSVFALRLSLHK